MFNQIAKKTDVNPETATPVVALGVNALTFTVDGGTHLVDISPAPGADVERVRRFWRMVAACADELAGRV